MKKNLYFYTLNLEPNDQLSLFGQDEQLKSTSLTTKVVEFINNKSCSENMYINKHKQFIVEIVDITKDYIFGSYGRFDAIIDGNLIRGRDRENFSLTELEDLIENYIYFYLDLNKNKIVILDNSKCTGFNKNFPIFLINHFDTSAIYKTIEIVNIMTKDITYALNKDTTFFKFNCSFSTEHLPANKYINTDNVFGLSEDNVTDVSINIGLNPRGNYANFLEKIKQLFHSPDDKYNSMKITTDEEVIDVVKKKISKKKSIKIDDDDINNLSKIKERLASHLSIY